VGDYNTVLNTVKEITLQTITLMHLRRSWNTLELVDIWRLKNPDLVRYTQRRLNQDSHLDYFLTFFFLASRVKVLIG
jgi:hypothetical protein